MSDHSARPGSDHDPAHLPVRAESALPPPVLPSGGGPVGGEFAPPPGFFDEEDEGGGFDPRRILAALGRYKWLVVVTTLLGAAGAAFAWTHASLQYTAAGSLWVAVDRAPTRSGEVAPIRQSSVFETMGYIEVLRSLSVLLPVVNSQQLYLRAPEDRSDVFTGFVLEDQFVPGGYRMEVSDAGDSWTLSHNAAGVVARGSVGTRVSGDFGFSFSPPAGVLVPGEDIEFWVVHPQEAARVLGRDLVTTTDREGNFIQVRYSGTDPVRITNILTEVLESHVEVARDIKRGRLDETLQVLEEQLVYAQQELAAAERALEDFRVRTITLPSDQATPISAGLEVTRDPVFDNYFDMQIDLETVRRDRQRVERVLAELPDSTIPVETLEAIPAAASSRELSQVLDELVDLRGQLRVLRDRYSDQYPPIQEILTRLRTISDETIPRILRGVQRELLDQENRLSSLLTEATDELSEIPVRSIEEARLRRQVGIQDNLYNELRSRVENARLAAASSLPDVRILDRPMRPTTPSDDPRVLLAGVLLLAGLAVGVVGAVLLDLVDSRVRYPTQVGRGMGLEILGSIPRIDKRRSKSKENQAQVLEAFRELRIAVGFAFGSAGPITLTVSSPSAGEGKSFITTNLAVAFADMGKRTLLIDGDTRRGDAHRLLGLPRTPGLTDYLKDRSVGDIVQSTSYRRLDFIGCGTRGSHTPELLASSRMSQFLGTLKRNYDVILIDSPPLSGGGDAMVLASLTGHLAVVIRTGSTDKSLAASKLEALSRFPIRLLGAILNDVDTTGGYGYYANYLPSYLTMGDEEGDVEEGLSDRFLVGKGSGGQGKDIS